MSSKISKKEKQTTLKNVDIFLSKLHVNYSENMYNNIINNPPKPYSSSTNWRCWGRRLLLLNEVTSRRRSVSKLWLRLFLPALLIITVITLTFFHLTLLRLFCTMVQVRARNRRLFLINLGLTPNFLLHAMVFNTPWTRKTGIPASGRLLFVGAWDVVIADITSTLAHRDQIRTWGVLLAGVMVPHSIFTEGWCGRKAG